jgi:hypothetical protein
MFIKDAKVILYFVNATSYIHILFIVTKKYVYIFTHA